jgi:hypothetical protein
MSTTDTTPNTTDTILSTTEPIPEPIPVEGIPLKLAEEIGACFGGGLCNPFSVNFCGGGHDDRVTG